MSSTIWIVDGDDERRRERAEQVQSLGFAVRQADLWTRSDKGASSLALVDLSGLRDSSDVERLRRAIGSTPTIGLVAPQEADMALLASLDLGLLDMVPHDEVCANLRALLVEHGAIPAETKENSEPKPGQVASVPPRDEPRRDEPRRDEPVGALGLARPERVAAKPHAPICPSGAGAATFGTAHEPASRSEPAAPPEGAANPASSRHWEALDAQERADRLLLFGETRSAPAAAGAGLYPFSCVVFRVLNPSGDGAPFDESGAWFDGGDARVIHTAIRFRCRTDDGMSYVGGGCWAVWLARCAANDARRVAERMADIVSAALATTCGGGYSVFAGISSSQDRTEAGGELLSRASWAAEEAEKTGRDIVTAAQR